MNKTYEHENGKLIIKYPFTDEHLRTLVIVLGNEGCVEFEGRDSKIHEDLDGNGVSWKLCDDLVEMGLLWEDDDAYELHYELTEDGENFIMNFH